MFALPATRVLAVGLLGVTLTMSVGCSNTSGGDKQASSGSSSTQAANNDDQQIRDLYEQGNAAVEDFNIDTILELTCAKNKPQMQASLDKAIPPMSQFGPPDKLAALGADKIVELLTQHFKPASEATIRKVAQALVDNDQDAYHAAMVEVFREGTTRKLVKIENIKVTGDTATADTTTTETVFTTPAKTKTEHSQALREDGQWKDCTPENAG